ncbi:Hpt domain-containing protein [Paraglaciecola sp.]|uniref:Hpt domain-containing protein n=1 Tax=Paraglaciecola sp. TaxID=1920173 RepID=UPI003EF48833
MTEDELVIFDHDFALKQFSGNETMLITILGKFVSQNENFNEQLISSFKSEDLTTAKRLIHTLKGVTGNLGMTALHHACKEVEDNFDSLAGDLTKLQDNLHEFLQLVELTILTSQKYGTQDPVANPTETTKIQETEPETEKQKLIAALQRNEFLSDKKLEQYLSALTLSPADEEELRKLIDDFEYPAAISLLN